MKTQKKEKQSLKLFLQREEKKKSLGLLLTFLITQAVKQVELIT